MKDGKIKYLRHQTCGKCDIEEINNIWLQKNQYVKDGEIKYLKQKPCGKWDMNKLLEHVQDNEIKVRCHNF